MVIYTGYAFNRDPDHQDKGYLGAVDAITGQRIWEVTLPDEKPTTGAPSVIAGRIWFAVRLHGTFTWHVYGYSTGGAKLLTFEVTGSSDSDYLSGSITGWRDRLFIRAADVWYAIPMNDLDGTIAPEEVIWSFDLGPCDVHNQNECPDTTSAVVAYPSSMNGPIVLLSARPSSRYPADPGGRVFAVPADINPADKVIDRTDPTEVRWKPANSTISLAQHLP